jgi:site-specific DNA-methyltransferase (adenine-specific)
MEYKVIHDDCLKVLKTLGAKTIDVVITSPPYNINIKYNQYKDNKKRDEYLDWLHTIFVEIKRVLKDDGHIFLNVGYTNIDPWIGMDVAEKLRDLYYLQNNITWIKSITLEDDITRGHFKPINSSRFINPTNEYIFHFTKYGKTKIDRLSIGVPYMDKSNLKERKKKKKKSGKEKKDKRCRGNSWFIPYKTIKNKKQKGYHPAIFPEKLVKWCLKLSGIKKGIVMDPFLGTGTTLQVTKQMSDASEKYCYSGIGMDIDKTYIEYARELLDINDSDDSDYILLDISGSG